MRRSIKTALVALTLAGASMAPLMSANAAGNVSISINPGGVAFGYSDGYWDRDHQWHAWQNASDATWYRQHYAQHYFAHRHDRDRDGGWRGERWWEQEHH